jgi:hypothetical protein
MTNDIYTFPNGVTPNDGEITLRVADELITFNFEWDSNEGEGWEFHSYIYNENLPDFMLHSKGSMSNSITYLLKLFCEELYLSGMPIEAMHDDIMKHAGFLYLNHPAGSAKESYYGI